MFKLMKLLDLDVATVNRNLFRHIHSIVESDGSFQASYVFSYLKGEMLSHVVNTSKIGMVLVDNFYELVYINDKACRILQCEDRSSLKLSDYIDPEVLLSKDTWEYPIQIAGGNYYFDKYAITLMDEVAGYYITLQEEAVVDHSSKTSRQKGFTAKMCIRDSLRTSQLYVQAVPPPPGSRRKEPPAWKTPRLAAQPSCEQFPGAAPEYNCNKPTGSSLHLPLPGCTGLLPNSLPRPKMCIRDRSVSDSD